MCSSFPGLLIGRTAVHSGKDPAFVAYDRFLSTGILQPLSRGEVRCGSNPVFEVMSAARPLFHRKRKSIGGSQRRHHCWLTNRRNAPTPINTASRIPTTSETTQCRLGLTSFDPAPFCAAPRPDQNRSLSMTVSAVIGAAL